MTVDIMYFDGRDKGLGSFASDFIQAKKEAEDANDRKSSNLLNSDWLDHFEGELAAKTSEQMDAYLSRRQPWKSTDYWNIYRTTSQPSLAYAVKIDSNGVVLLIALGICYRYPEGDLETWWANVIEPRVRRLL